MPESQGLGITYASKNAELLEAASTGNETVASSLKPVTRLRPSYVTIFFHVENSTTTIINRNEWVYLNVTNILEIISN